jgi:hypothetical protein
LTLGQSRPEQFSENGWFLSPHGTIRILVIYAEIDYDKSPERDPQPKGATHWPKGQLPKWKDEVFDTNTKAASRGMVSKYYHDISLGQYTVLGDYIPVLVTIKESDHKNLFNLSAAAVAEANKLGAFRTAGGLSVADFDMWKDDGRPGQPKEIGADSPHKFDHTMVIVRNSDRLTHGQGSTDAGSPGKLFGYESDTQSRFGAMNALPFDILKHEFNHMLLGGNNFHSGGGNAKMFESYFICIQGGWSMMGAANSSLLTCSGWDRYRLGWTPKGSPYPINAQSITGSRVNGDLDPINGDTGTFVLRDFVTTGDVIRIKLPYLDDDEFPQWIWLENHQTEARNGSPTDVFHYQDMDCVQNARPGIYAMLQVDREEKRGTNIFGGRADYLKPLSARGCYDFRLRGDTVQYDCLWPGPTTPIVTDDNHANPLSGWNDLELLVFNSVEDDLLNRATEAITPRIEVRNGKTMDAGQFFGHSDQAFTVSGNNKMGLATNPPLANVTTLVSKPGRDALSGGKPNNRIVHLSGISVELLEQRSSGAITVRVSNSDNTVADDTRWCGDSLVVHPNTNKEKVSVLIRSGATLTVDRSGTPSRITDPELIKGQRHFNSATALTLLDGATMELEEKATLIVRGGSTIHVLPGSTLKLGPKSRLIIREDAKVVVHPGGKFQESGTSKMKCSGGGCVVSR